MSRWHPSRRTAQRAERRNPLTADVGEGGFSLVDVVMSIALLGIGMVGLLGVWGNTVLLSDRARVMSSAAGLSVSASEAIQDPNRNPYVRCASTSTYSPSVGVGPVPAGLIVSVVDVQYWDGASFGVSCLDNDPNVGRFTRLQRVTVRVRSSDQRVNRTLSVLKREVL
jgi:type II secretory pathway pseudopilin PulG